MRSLLEEVSSAESPGWSGARRRVINLIERRAILKRLNSLRHQGPHQMAQFIPVVLVSIGVWSNAHACDVEMDNATAAKFSSSFRELRSTNGHFNGGTWTPAVDAWGGAKNLAMQCLAKHAVARGLASDRLQELMGAPDEVVPCPSRECKTLAGQAQWRGDKPVLHASALWIYRWRGQHDRLAFAMRDGAVRADGWLFVHE
jgi:hypothetical protein